MPTLKVNFPVTENFTCNRLAIVHIIMSDLIIWPDYYIQNSSERI